MNIRNIIKKSLLPQHAVSEIFVSSILALYTFFLADAILVDVGQGIYTVAGLGVSILLSSYILFLAKSKTSTFLLKIVQILGSVIILTISTLYVSRIMLSLDLSDLDIFNYLFLLYASIVMLRFFILVSLIFGSSKLTVLKKSLINIIKEMPYAKYDNALSPTVLILILISTITYIYLKKGQLVIALGESMFVSLFVLDILSFKRKTYEQ